MKAPDYNLDVGSLSHGAQTGLMLQRIEAILERERGDAVMVYGDTNSTLAGALAAAKMNVPVVHVEAGLRSFNKQMPEEINRVLTDHVSRLLLVPNTLARQNLLREGCCPDSIVEVGDVMYDAFLAYQPRALLAPLSFELPHQYVLCTIHRQENTIEESLVAIFAGLKAVSEHVPVLLPLHPRTRQALESFKVDCQGLTLLPPQGYLEMLKLESLATLIATDSGGVQKEAYFAKVPCVTLRRETEWPELIETGWNVLIAPTLSSGICSTILSRRGVAGRDVKLYGEGRACEAIAGALLKLSSTK